MTATGGVEQGAPQQARQGREDSEMARRPRGELEASVLGVLWDAADWLSPQEVNVALDRSLAYTTVTTVLTRLVAKGTVERRPAGRGFTYRPVASREEQAAARMGEVLAAAGDRTMTLSRFVESLDPDERERLRRAIHRAPPSP
jgi:predicted transcriptional regulator